MRLLAAGGVAALCAAAALCIVSAEQSRLEHEQEQHAGAAAQLAAAEASLALEHAARLLAAVAMPEDGSALLGAACEHRLQELQSLHEGYRHLALFDTRGRVICSTAAQPDRSLNLSGNEIFRRALRTSTGEASGLVRCPVTGKRGVVLLQPIMQGPAVIGVLLASMGFGDIAELVHAADLPAGATMAVVNREGVVFEAFPEHGLIGKKIPEADAFGRRAADHADEFLAIAPRQGVQLAAYARIRGLAEDENAYARVTLPGSAGLPWLWVLALGVASFSAMLWVGGRLDLGRFVPGGPAPGVQHARLVGRYKARRDGESYAYEVSWTSSATGVQWEAKVRLAGELVGLPSGEMPPARGLHARRAVRRAIESAIEHRIA